MRHFKFDLRIQLVLIALRKHKGIKQETMCIPLNLDRTSYSRIENGRTAISFGQLQVIAEELGVSTEITRMFANAFEISDFEHKSIDEILSNFIVANNPSREKIIFSYSELHSIFSIIKRYCPKIVSLKKLYQNLL